MADTKKMELESVPLLINGKPTCSTPSAKFPVFSLDLGRDVHLAESADVQAATRAADASWIAFQSWKNSAAVTRRKILLRYAELLRGHEEDLVAVQRLETSVSELWARKNVRLPADLVEEVAACVTRLEGVIPQPQTASSMALVLPVPVGPVLSIAPWNSSVILGARSIATPVAAGCTVVFKASELCPKTHHMLVSILGEAGLPDGVVNVIQTARHDAATVTEALISHPAIKKVEFIGSASVGRAIGQLCGKHLKPILMELGGKGPVLVLADANLEDAAEKCVAGAFLHHGQLCFSTERVIVVESVAKRFQELLKQKAPNFPPGSGVSQQILGASLDKLRDAQQKGATFLVGGPEMASHSSLVPTIVTGVTKEMQVSDEEAFGPSFSLSVAKDDREAIQMANDTKYGLNAAIHSTNMQHALEVAREIDTAQIHINSMTAHDEPTLPVGGMKGSGWGRNNGLWGLREFTDVKVITFSPKGNDFV
ncbi:Vanillin dehydrogenase [Cladophialophora carrionii]|uniref:Vanillin dehydrogenase n=1 Tax=Cladophialophora carrionii TaxID=86049 RepID=A0A1C1CP08_9EURO|nr:Vanillin dehydrogenase [Cladophialophora carrionii]